MTFSPWAAKISGPAQDGAPKNPMLAPTTTKCMDDVSRSYMKLQTSYPRMTLASHISSKFSPRNMAILAVLAALLSSAPLLLSATPEPAPWPERFHAVLFMNLSGFEQLQVTDLWYDWPAGRNVNLIQKQLGHLVHDVEWDNGTSYYYTSIADGGSCRVVDFGVGIPRRDFMDGSTYLGRRRTDGFLCDVWVKLDFIWYYEDVVSRRPVRWDFYQGISTHVMTFEVGKVLDEVQWQAPYYCFSKEVLQGQGSEPSDRRNALSMLQNLPLRAVL